MEPNRTSGWCPGGGCADWAVCGERGWGSLVFYRVKRGVTLLFLYFELGTKLGTVGKKKKRAVISHCIICLF